MVPTFEICLKCICMMNVYVYECMNVYEMYLYEMYMVPTFEIMYMVPTFEIWYLLFPYEMKWVVFIQLPKMGCGKASFEV